MPSKSSRSHPVRQALDASASGHPPTRKELDELVAEVTGGMSAADVGEWRSALELACQSAAQQRADGANRDARQSAVDNTARLVNLLADEWSPTDPEPFDAEKVADAVRASRRGF